MGDPSVEVSEENRDASQEAKIQAMEAISEGTFCISWMWVMFNLTNYFLMFNNLVFHLIGKLDEAIENLTKAIMLNPTSAIMYASRGA